MTRRTTNLLIGLMEEGVIEPEALVKMCLTYMSESDVEDMARCNELFVEIPEEEDNLFI